MNDQHKLDYRHRTEPTTSDYSFSITRREATQLLAAGLTCSITRAQTDAGRIHLADDGAVTVFTGKVELGQGSRTLIAQAAAEELRVPLNHVTVVMGDTARVPDDGGTWASLTTPQTIPLIRRAAALLRQGTPTPAKDWKVLGQSVPAINARAIVTGALRYASDLKQPNMRQARVVRPPAYNAKLSKVNGTPAAQQGDFLAVFENQSVRPEWQEQPLPPESELHASLKQTAEEPVAQPNARYPPLITKGDAKQTIAASQRVVRAEYSLPFIAHVPLEPRAAIAQFQDGRLTIWTGNQAPFLAREDVARATGLAKENIRIIAHETGSGFGGKQRGEVETEAARVAIASPGAPVRLAWTREEEFERSYFRPAGLMSMAAALDADGRIEAWEHHNYCSGPSGLMPPYDFAHHWCGFHRTASPLRHGSYRSLAAVANTFAREMHMEECALAAKIDPLDYRLLHVKNDRLREVAERGAEKFGWARRKNAGVSLTIEKNGHLACFVAVEGARVTEALIVADFGAALNPGNLRNQIEGGFIQSLGGALFERIRYGSTRILNASLSRYRVPRFSDVPPKFDVILIDRREIEPAGAGEAPITIGAPAIAAAMSRQRGQRLRHLPLT